jgi:glycine cleavage system aminomethyltransferase T
VSDAGFPYLSARRITVGNVPLLALRVTYVGELGWELYVPAEFAVGVYEQLIAAGGTNAGYSTINSLRLEKGYRAFGAELTPDYTPVEAGLLFACKLKTDIAFLGREAVEKVRGDGPRRRLVSFVLGDSDVMMWGGELVLRDGVAVGQVTSAAYGDTIGACVGLAYLWQRDGSPVTPDYVKTGAYEINVGGQLAAASVSLRSPYDPESAKIRR